MNDKEFKEAMSRNRRLFRCTLIAIFVLYFSYLGWVVWGMRQL